MGDGRGFGVVACLVLAAATLWSERTAAASFVVADQAALLAGADGFVRARVVADISAAPSARGIVASTRYALAVERHWGGTLGARAVLALPGSPAGHPRGVRVAGVPHLLPGSEILLAYQRRTDGDLAAHQLALGVFIGGTADGRRIWRPSTDAAAAVGDGVAKAHDAERLEAWLDDAVAGRRRPLDAMIPVATLDVGGAAKFTLLLDPGTGRPIRWFDFDGGGELAWHALDTGQSGWGGALAAVPAALAAWRDDPGSRIALVDAGVVDQDAGIAGPDGRSAVVWNDPQDVIAGSFDCAAGGVLAIGGSFYETNTGPGPGGSFHRAIEGFVIVQDGAGCYLAADGGRHGAEVLTHEIGHALGFGHSCGDAASPACAGQPVFAAATMRAVAHGDGRGAAIRDDDRAAAATIYPQQAGPDGVVFADQFEE